MIFGYLTTGWEQEHIYITTNFLVTALAFNFFSIEMLDVCEEAFNMINLVA
jgi:hypothetical protein